MTDRVIKNIEFLVIFTWGISWKMTLLWKVERGFSSFFCQILVGIPKIGRYAKDLGEKWRISLVSKNLSLFIFLIIFTQNIFVKLHNIRIPNPSLINNNMSSLQMICIGICRVIHYRVRNSKSNFEIPAFFDVWIRNFKSGKFQTSSFKFQIVGEDLKVIIFVPYPIIYNPG